MTRSLTGDSTIPLGYRGGGKLKQYGETLPFKCNVNTEDSNTIIVLSISILVISGGGI